MSPIAWIIMLGSLSSVVALTAYCYYKVLTLPPLEPDEHL